MELGRLSHSIAAHWARAGTRSYRRGAVGVRCLEFEAPKRKHVGGTKLSKPVTVFLSSNVQVPPSPQLAERVKRANALGEIPPPGDQ